MLIYYNYPNVNVGSSRMGKLYFNLWPFFPSSSFECSLYSTPSSYHTLLCFHLLCCFYSALTFLQPSPPAAASGSYALHTILSREVVFWLKRSGLQLTETHLTSPASSSYNISDIRYISRLFPSSNKKLVLHYQTFTPP